MQVDTEKTGEVLVIGISGRIDGVTAPELESRLTELIDAGERKLVIDLDGVDYISSAGLRVMLYTAKKLRKEGRLALSRPRDMVREVFDVAGFGSVLTIVDDREAAKALMEK